MVRTSVGFSPDGREIYATKDDGFVSFYFGSSNDFYSFYDLSFTQCDTEKDLKWWLRHLREKVWFTPSVERYFRESVAEKNGVVLHE